MEGKREEEGEGVCWVEVISDVSYGEGVKPLPPLPLPSVEGMPDPTSLQEGVSSAPLAETEVF